MPSLSAVLQKNPSFVSRRIADEVLLVPISHKVGEIDCLYALNEVSARIWGLSGPSCWTARAEVFRSRAISPG
jgi:hypothetical protein